WERKQLDDLGAKLSTGQTERLGKLPYGNEAQLLAQALVNFDSENNPTAVAHKQALDVITVLRGESPEIPKKGTLTWKALGGSDQRPTGLCQAAGDLAERGRLEAQQAREFLDEAAGMLPASLKPAAAYVGARAEAGKQRWTQAAKLLAEAVKPGQKTPAI